MEEENSFLGRGWAFPPAFDAKSKKSVMAEEEEDIRQSLFIIISTTPGERIMNPKFGCDLISSVFDNIDSLAVNRMKDLIRTAILNYEPRITLHEVIIDTSQSFEGVVHITMEYTIRKINVRTNIVYPFYLKEGTNVTGM
ncbi:GPW/gp25 family protein [Marivirga sp. S37H4]|uniref:GPW/gp25 family protein n=1 Tax=Marivirga aurantiaca TaxID=2802615 RepID=A0A934WY52_9BACT|nr:GPW/gp25 family protein [Marivirga aurantiaca]MBK6265144.1 GPW/gp25 family protein [Marivirga aurantiaca]